MRTPGPKQDNLHSYSSVQLLLANERGVRGSHGEEDKTQNCEEEYPTKVGLTRRFHGVLSIAHALRSSCCAALRCTVACTHCIAWHTRTHGEDDKHKIAKKYPTKVGFPRRFHGQCIAHAWRSSYCAALHCGMRALLNLEHEDPFTVMALYVRTRLS